MVRCRALLVVTVGVAIAGSLSCGHNQPAPSIAESVDALMSELYDQGYFNGAVVVGRGDQVLYERGFGLANVEEGLSFTPDTPSHGASMAKTLTAAAILILEEDGRIDLDDPVTTQLPEFPYPEVTIRHLISHDSGLHPEAVYFNTFAPQADKRTNDRLLEILAEHKPPLAFPPGSAFEYSSTGYIMAALLIERATGQSYAAFLQERIFDPLEMNSSFVRPAEDGDWKRPRTLGYRRIEDGALELFDQPPNRQVYGQGRLDYSTHDLYRWVSSFYSNPVLGAQALRTGLEPSILGSEHQSALTLLNWYHAGTGRRFYFTGDAQGHYTFAYWDADRRQAIVFMSNVLMPSWLKPKLAIALIDILEGRRSGAVEDPKYVSASVPISQAMPSLGDFASILGEYDTKPAGRVSIENPPPNWLNIGWVLKDGWFAPVVRVNGGLAYSMFPVEPGMFYVPGVDAWVGFTEGDGGMTLHWTRLFEGTSTGTRVGE